VIYILGDNGIIALRIACAIFQAIGLFIAMLLLIKEARRPEFLFWLLATIILLLWMFPLLKSFDFTASLALIGSLAFLIRNPSRERYFLTGLCVGFFAFIGRNHGLYGVVGSLAAIVYISFAKDTLKSIIKNLAFWSIGIVTGYLPMLGMLAFVPDFARILLKGALIQLKQKSTNLPLPVPWPWDVTFAHQNMLSAICNVMVGSLFIVILAYGVIGIACAVWLKSRNKAISPALLASFFLALPYAHYAYSRADAEHLALGIFPFLIGGLIGVEALQGARKWCLLSLFLLVTILIQLPQYPWATCYLANLCVKAEVAKDKLLIERGSAKNLAVLNRLAEQYAPHDRAFLIVPSSPAAYAAFGRKSPLWEVSSYFFCDQNFEREEIERLKQANPGFVIIDDVAQDGREALRFSNIRPLLNAYILQNFMPLQAQEFYHLNGSIDRAYHIYIAKGASQNGS
jgi:hypothetical protein